MGIIKKLNEKIKLLAKGKLNNKINIEVSASSVSAKESVEKIGGVIKIVAHKRSDKKINEKSEA